MAIEISVIICTYNPKEEYINQAIDGIFFQDFPKEKWEFFIIDNNSSFKVADLAKVKTNNIRVIEEKTPGLTAAREAGVKNAVGEIIVFVDDDNILRNDYLTNVSELFTKYKDLGVVSGEILPIYEVEPPKWFHKFESAIAIRRFSFEHTYFTRIPSFSYFFPIGAGICIRKKILLLYFQDLKNNLRIEGRKGTSLSSGEDLDIDFFVLYVGFCLCVSKGLFLYHLIPPSRLSHEYIKDLNIASLKSIMLINKKWRKIFNKNVFPIFDSNLIVILIKFSLLLLGYFFIQNRIRVHQYLVLIKNLISRGFVD